MLWSLIGLIGGGTFIFNGFSILFDSSCDSVSFGGGRVVRATCYQDGSGINGDFPGAVAGIGMLLIGAVILFFALRSFKRR